MLLELLERTVLPIKLFITESLDAFDLAAVLESVPEKYMDRVQASPIRNTSDLFTLYGQAACVIATRMHSAILAMTQYVPVIVLAWQDKCRGLAAAFDALVPLYDLNNLANEAVQITDTVISLCDRRNEVSEKLEQAVSRVREALVDAFPNL